MGEALSAECAMGECFFLMLRVVCLVACRIACSRFSSDGGIEGASMLGDGELSGGMGEIDAAAIRRMR